MKSLLVGNGLNIQFSGSEYLNEAIIKRAFQKINTGDFPSEIYPFEIGEYVERLFELVPMILKGKLHQLFITDSEKESLREFIDRYRFHKGKLRIHQIGFEDYFLLHIIFCRLHKIKNPEKFHFKEAMKCFFIDSIYNDGKINELYKQFPDNLKPWFLQFDTIFTTNYDKNIETFIQNKVHYLHGAFHIKQDIYNPDSFRNQLSDRPIDNAPIIEGYDHLYSTALTSGSGESKLFAGEMHAHANNGIDKFVDGIKKDPSSLKQIEPWKNESNILLKNMYEGIMLKLKNPELKFNDYYPFDDFKTINGSLSILGLSPNNDLHLFRMIHENDGVNDIIYYYFDIKDGRIVEEYFQNKKVLLLDVKQFWEEIIKEKQVN